MNESNEQLENLTDRIVSVLGENGVPAPTRHYAVIYSELMASRASQSGVVAVRVGDALLKFGYAPGNYFFICTFCGEQKIAAKRSIRCRECAEYAATIAKGGEEGK